jgi:hypothetical protein
MPRPDIGEWWPIWRYSTFYTAVFCAALAIAGYAIAKLGLRAARGVPVLAAMAIASCLHVRMAPLFAVVWVAWVPAWASATPLGRRIGGLVQRRELITVLCLVLMMFLVPWFLRVRPLRLAVPNDVYPVGAVRYLAEEGFRGNVMAPFEVGAYVTWRLFPSAKVFVDSRYDIAFPPRIVEESFRFYKAEPGWQTILAEYPTDVVLARREAPVNRVMEAAGWKRVYVDRSFEIYARPDLRLALRNDSGKDFRGAFP